MLLALTLGLTGSLSHCVGMCSGVVLLLNRSLDQIKTNQWTWVFIHAGRVFSYALLGILFGFIGQSVSASLPDLRLIQGTLALFAGLLGVYFALSILGRVPSIETLFPALVSGWRKLFGKQLKTQPAPFLIGLLWGLLPCGLLFTALFTVAFTASPLVAGLSMLIFGLATLPALFGVQWMSSRKQLVNISRYASAALLLVFGIQLWLRGMAAFGFINHLMLGEVMLW